MYDELSLDYDRFVNWPSRLAVELPFLHSQLSSIDARLVLDAACGTGQHAIALAQRGYSVTAVDASENMISQARTNARRAGVDIKYHTAHFGQIASQAGTGFDALLCLGNSLPHVMSEDALRSTLADFATCLRPGGLLLIQNRNFDGVLARGDRWMEPQAHQEEDYEWLFLRFYDFEADGNLTFNMVTLRRQKDRSWEQRVMSTRLWPQLHNVLAAALTVAGFNAIVAYGDMAGAPFERLTSGNLVLMARRALD